MKVIGQYFHALLFILLYEVVKICVVIQMNAIEQHSHVILFV